MPKMIVSIDEVVIKEVQLVKDRTTIGRRPYNDVVIDNLAVSGEHAVVQFAGNDVYIEDLNSTNGTYVNGKAVKRQQLAHGDSIEIGKYKIKFAGELGQAVAAVEKPPAAKNSGFAQLNANPSTGFGTISATEAAASLQASIKVLSGVASGREVLLSKVVTTIGKPGVAVAAITRRQQGYVVHHVEGSGNPTLNGAPLGPDPVALQNGDVVELAGTKMQFIQG
ncbi:FHA domain-containing protein [Curvibacter sp. CHRR-16]|uniref:FHA domain-containing protein n=1 Tax=Curvibacter sp. CHRR-16 TaxID=2835872 RepID=UPI001BDAA3E0|nr:FHA domain-containing protein [Curvibacter sp. CHRR-16]MBT0570414.1 FHA domain-containing protein [Curvibacter sp. CHRR-16]